MLTLINIIYMKDIFLFFINIIIIKFIIFLNSQNKFCTNSLVLVILLIIILVVKKNNKILNILKIFAVLIIYFKSI